MAVERYIVRWLKDGLIVDIDHFSELKEAERHAMGQIKVYRALDFASSAIIYDEDGKERMRVY